MDAPPPTDRPAGATSRRRVVVAGASLAAALVLLALLSLQSGSSGSFELDLGTSLRGALAYLGWAEPLGLTEQTVIELRLFRTLAAVGVGAALALSGALLQGVFRNDLASPSILGVTSGAGLGASLAILVLGGYGPIFLVDQTASVAPLFVTLSAFLGAVTVLLVVTVCATHGGRVSVPTLLLVGIAVNAVAGGMLAAVQSSALSDFEVARAIYAWGFGTLDDRSGAHVSLLFGGLALACAAVPFVARELDLFAAGEDDAAGLGVATGRVKLLSLVAAALSASVAVAVAGQIAFIGLLVPHILRLAVERSHRSLLVLCVLAGPVFLLGSDLAQRWLLGASYLRPGVLMSLFGGPFFLFLLLRNRREVRAW